MALILVVDDERSIRDSLALILDSEGHQVLTAGNGREARAHFEARPDVVITDILMPDDDGLMLLRNLRQQMPDTRVIAISGGGRIEPEMYLKMARSIGADRVFAKPVPRDLLLGAVNELTGG